MFSPTGIKAKFSVVMSSSGVMSLPKLNKASMAILVSSLLAGLVIVDDSFLLAGRGGVRWFCMKVLRDYP